jgi:hypothetical protein
MQFSLPAEIVADYPPDLLNAAQKAFQKEAERKARRITDHVEFLRQISTDEGFEELNKEQTKYGGSPMVRRKTYGKWCGIPYPGICAYGIGIPEEEHPTLMRGSKAVLHAKYGKGYNNDHPNGWHERVAERYLRMIKFTSLGEGPFHGKIYERIHAKYGRFSGGRFDNPACGIHIKGERIWGVNPAAMPALKSLLKHIDKLNDLDKCVKRINEGCEEQK